ncbi:MAG: hypothetical protein IT260_18110 [Saprospiraceae bacterium]|nr:hypothetical protein [Saprospiraceae bacterium]
MFSDKLLVLLQTFSKYNLNRFRKFLLSPYFNDQEDVTRLFDLVNEALRTGPGAVAALDKTSVWQHLYPKKTFDDGHLRRLASDLTLQAQRFLVEEARQEAPVTEALDLYKALEKPELQKHQDAVERQVQKLLSQSKGKSTDYYFAQFQLHFTILNRASKVVGTDGYTEKLALADFHLECFYLAQKLKLYIAWILYRGFRVTVQEVPVMPGFWEYLQDERFDAVPLIRMYRKAILSFTDSENEAHFQDYLTDLDLCAAELALPDLRECYFMAQNYCALKINQGKIPYYYKYFALIKSMADQEILLDGEQLPESVFKNFITVSLGAGEYVWTEQFIQRYAEYLPANIRENARMFNLAYVYFYQKNYSKVIEYLRDVEYSDVVYALGAKSMLVRTYYEQGEYLALDSLIDSFKIFLRRNKVISKNLKREYNNFLNLVKKLTMTTASDKKTIAELQRRVQEASVSMPRNWLLKKINEIEGGAK